MKQLVIILLAPFLIQCSQSIATNNFDKEQNSKGAENTISEKNEIPNNKIIQRDSSINYNNLSAEEWKEILTEKEFDILRKKGTERAFSGEYNSNKKTGIYHCKGCNTKLFSSEAKFDSGTGWPSFYDEINDNVKEKKDNSYGMQRIELVCKTCSGHLGHVFNDGPKPTGLRYCINSLSLDFKEQ